MSARPHVPPPDELRALCSMAGVRWTYVTGRPANTWKVYVRCLPDGMEFARMLQVTDHEVWLSAVQWLDKQRREHIQGQI